MENNETKKVKIIFDTNVFLAGDKVSFEKVISDNINKLNKFIVKNKIKGVSSVCITETIKEEGLKELIDKINQKYRSFTQNCNNIQEKFGSLSPNIYKNKINIKKVEEKIIQLYNKKIQENLTEVIPLYSSKINFKTLFDNAISYKVPFEREDKGFKDTTIWLSMLENSKLKKNKGVFYLFVTSDGVFTKNKESFKEEFKKETKNKIEIIKPDILEERLDDILKLGKGFKKIKEEVIEKIKSDSSFKGELERIAFEKINKNSHDELYSPDINLTNYNPEWKEKIVNLIYDSADISVKNSLSKELFEIDANIIFSAKYNNSQKDPENNLKPLHNNPNYIVIPTLISTTINDDKYPEKLKQKSILNYDKKSKSLKIIDTIPVEPYMAEFSWY